MTHRGPFQPLNFCDSVKDISLSKEARCSLRIIESQNHRIIKVRRTSEITKSNCQPNTTMPANPCPKVQYLHIF